MNGEILAEKYKNCVSELDPNQKCETCKHLKRLVERTPCSICFTPVLGLPVNPTKYEPVPAPAHAAMPRP